MQFRDLLFTMISGGVYTKLDIPLTLGVWVGK